jgi:hypothetical protein
MKNMIPTRIVILECLALFLTAQGTSTNDLKAQDKETATNLNSFSCCYRVYLTTIILTSSDSQWVTHHFHYLLIFHCVKTPPMRRLRSMNFMSFSCLRYLHCRILVLVSQLSYLERRDFGGGHRPEDFRSRAT